MTENIQVKNHLDNFNQIILDLQGVEITNDDDDQTIILCPLPNSYENIVDTILYERDSISISDVNDVIQSKELKKRVSNLNEDGAETRLFVDRDKNNKRDNERR